MVNEVNDLKGLGTAVLNSDAATTSGHGHSPRAHGEAKAGPPSLFGRHQNAFPGGPPPPSDLPGLRVGEVHPPRTGVDTRGPQRPTMRIPLLKRLSGQPESPLPFRPS
jgi:hypothetical protein